MEFVQNIVKSLRSTRSDYLLTGKDKAAGNVTFELMIIFELSTFQLLTKLP